MAAVRQHLVAEVEGRKLGTLGTMEGKETVLLGLKGLMPTNPRYRDLIQDKPASLWSTDRKGMKGLNKLL